VLQGKLPDAPSLRIGYPLHRSAPGATKVAATIAMAQIQMSGQSDVPDLMAATMSLARRTDTRLNENLRHPIPNKDTRVALNLRREMERHDEEIEESARIHRRADLYGLRQKSVSATLNLVCRIHAPADVKSPG
jgi:hypothetical protein